jgi:O-antigen ligase
VRTPTPLFAALLLLLFTLPLPMGANRDWLWPWFAVATFGLLAIVLAGYAVARWTLPGTLRRAWVFIAAAVLALMAGLPHLGAPGWLDGMAPVDPAGAANALLLQSMYLALALLVLLLGDRRRRLLAIAVVLFAAGSVQALVGVAMAASGGDWSALLPAAGQAGVAHGTFVNRNHFAGYLALTGALGIGLLVAQMGSQRTQGWRAMLRGGLSVLLGPRTWLRAALAMVVVGLVLSQSRMGNLSFFVALGAGALLALAAWKPMPRNLVWLFASLVVVDLLLLGSWFGVERVAQRLRETTTQVAPANGRDSDAERLVVSRATLDMWRAHPWWGVGPGGFRTAFPAHKPASVALFYDHAHNDWAQLLAERGVVGALPVLLALGLAWIAAVRAVRLRHDPRLRGIGLGCAIGMLAFALHGLVDFNAQIPANAATLWVVAALAAATRWLPERAHPRTPGAG